MTLKLKKSPVAVIVVVSLALTLLLSLMIHKEITLLYFINISFYFCSAYIMLGLLLMVVDKGFFDGISYSFRKVFKRTNKLESDEDSDITPLSEVVSIPYSPFLYSGLVIMGFMLIGLMFWY